MLKAVFAGKGKLSIAEEQDGVSSLIASVEAGVGVALMPRALACLAGERLKLLPLTPAPKPLVIGALWPQAGLTAAAERFLEAAKEFAVTPELVSTRRLP